MKFTWLASAALVAAASSTQAAELSSTITFTSDYRYHGISQTAGDPALQGSIDLAFDNGAYVGIWGSNVDFGDDANLEVDYYAGYAGSINDEVSYNAMLLWFQYPGYEAFDGDYGEVELGLYYKNFSLIYDYAWDFFNLDEPGHYIALNYSHPINDQVSLDLHAGHSFGDYWDDIDIGAYEDYSVGLSSNIGGLNVSLAYLFNEVDSGMKVDQGVFHNDDTVLITISRSF